MSIDLTSELYSFNFVLTLGLSALIQIFVSFLRNKVGRFYRLSISSLRPSSKPKFFDVFHSSKSFLFHVWSVFSTLTLMFLNLKISLHSFNITCISYFNICINFLNLYLFLLLFSDERPGPENNCTVIGLFYYIVSVLILFAFPNTGIC